MAYEDFFGVPALSPPATRFRRGYNAGEQAFRHAIAELDRLDRDVLEGILSAVQDRIDEVAKGDLVPGFVAVTHAETAETAGGEPS